MTDTSSESEVPQVAPWLRATRADLDGFDFEQVIAGSTAADSRELGELYRDASVSASSDGDEPKAQTMVRMWNFLSAITGMHFKPQDTTEPFGPMWVLAGGGRSAIAADFRKHRDLLEALAEASTNVVLRSRLSDVAWLLDRKKPALGVAAVRAYVDLVRGIEAGELSFRTGDEDQPFHPGVKDYLVRALGLARMLGWEKPEAEAARAQLVTIRKRAAASGLPIPVGWYCGLDLQMRVSDPLEIAAEIEGVLANLPDGTDHHSVVDLWRLASRAYQAAKMEDDKQRCQVACAEVLVEEAGRIATPLLSADLLARAIAALHGVPSARARRTELRHRLVEVQANIREELQTFSHELDLKDLIDETENRLKPLGLYESLFVFAVLDQSPAPEILRKKAIEHIREHPLSSLFGAVHLDDEGKVVHRTASGGGETDEPAIERQIAQDEQIRRHITVASQIDPARRTLNAGSYLSDDIFYALVSSSPFTPDDLGHTFARGFTRFFQGDLTSALYILTPLLENSLRHVLKAYGHDVTTFDNATQTQDDRTITALFAGMRMELDSIFTRAITEDIERVFLSRPGPAVRHGVAHGLLHDGMPYGPDAIYACWLIFRLCLLPLFPYRQELGLT